MEQTSVLPSICPWFCLSWLLPSLSVGVSFEKSMDHGGISSSGLSIIVEKDPDLVNIVQDLAEEYEKDTDVPVTIITPPGGVIVQQDPVRSLAIFLLQTSPVFVNMQLRVDWFR